MKINYKVQRYRKFKILLTWNSVMQPHQLELQNEEKNEFRGEYSEELFLSLSEGLQWSQTFILSNLIIPQMLFLGSSKLSR